MLALLGGGTKPMKRVKSGDMGGQAMQGSMLWLFHVCKTAPWMGCDPTELNDAIAMCLPDLVIALALVHPSTMLVVEVLLCSDQLSCGLASGPAVKLHSRL